MLSRCPSAAALGALLCVLFLNACGSNGDDSNSGGPSSEDASDASIWTPDDAETLDDDAGARDAGTRDAAATDVSAPDSAMPDSAVLDASVRDSAVPDSAVPDSGVPDSGVPDSAVPDSGVPDSAVPDSGVPDSGVPDSGVPDSGTGPTPSHAGIVANEGVDAWDALPNQARAEVAAMHVFFGHQSVGLNIIDGIKNLGGVQVRDWVSSGTDFNTPGIGHQYIGRNEFPFEKIDDFEGFLASNRIGDAVDVAAMKLCWIDFTADSTNVGAIEAAYEAALQRLQSSHPAMHFVHITTPLERYSTPANRRRLAYGTWMKSTYGQTDMVFDLAIVQSTQPDGTPCTRDGVRELCEMYASDNGHLNALGRERAAKAFLYALYNAR
ncbi:MAG: hypothetical protein IPK13_14285 [Deltaproteobacteria bacterium]|nr:hypothetical protein [Deltaproteobacteria bacterium]